MAEVLIEHRNRGRREQRGRGNEAVWVTSEVDVTISVEIENVSSLTLGHNAVQLTTGSLETGELILHEPCLRLVKVCVWAVSYYLAVYPDAVSYRMR